MMGHTLKDKVRETFIIGIFGGKFSPVNVTVIGPLIGGFIAG